MEYLQELIVDKIAIALFTFVNAMEQDYSTPQGLVFGIIYWATCILSVVACAAYVAKRRKSKHDTQLPSGDRT